MIDPTMAEHWQFLLVREVPGQGDCAIQNFIFTRGLVTNVKLDLVWIDYDARYCYESTHDAVLSLATWDGIGDPPGDWIKEKVSERLGPGTRCRVHTDTFFTPHIQYKHGTYELETERVYCCPVCRDPRDPKPHPGPFTPAREAVLRAKPAHYCVHEVWPQLDALRTELAALRAAAREVVDAYYGNRSCDTDAAIEEQLAPLLPLVPKS